MSSLGLGPAPRPGAGNALKTRKAVCPNRAVLGEVTNFSSADVNTKKTGPTKQLVPKTKPVAKLGPVVPDAAASVQPDGPELQPAPAAGPAGPGWLRPVSEDPVDGSMEEDQGDERLCQAFSEVLLSVQDVDEQDGDQPQLCSQYVKDIYKYLHELEVQQAVRPDYMRGYEITGAMRALLVDWLVQVHSRFQLLQETLFLTVAVLDRFLQVQPVSRRKLQLVGVASMLVACKYEETFSPTAGDFAYITDGAFTAAQVLTMEQLILTALRFRLGRPLPLHFLRRNSKCDVERHTLAKYLMELTLLDYELVQYRPSEVAAASLCLSQLLLAGLPWSPTQRHYSSYDEEQLQPLVRHIAKNLVLVNEGRSKFLAVKRKYSSSRLLQVSLAPQLRSAAVRQLAAPLLAS
ncbi:G2/mitotic-specific cyclin-B2 isoform X2 [Salarias fasciatus]|uniref:G2/mitotic-specific cyclin-B2 isoform X2 n=1 Tax=Salarias fasciatus TaxID=181472 RepID=UPI001176B65B|nr:G2/mitotic-specific cyclin-B2-like isoform X2 [Salarias fasciatus]